MIIPILNTLLINSCWQLFYTKWGIFFKKLCYFPLYHQLVVSYFPTLWFQFSILSGVRNELGLDADPVGENYRGAVYSVHLLKLLLRVQFPMHRFYFALPPFQTHCMFLALFLLLIIGNLFLYFLYFKEQGKFHPGVCGTGARVIWGMFTAISSIYQCSWVSAI